jgi:hypothetical protein
MIQRSSPRPFEIGDFIRRMAAAIQTLPRRIRKGVAAACLAVLFAI